MKSKLVFFICLWPVIIFAQNQAKSDIDPSKPTNLYTQVNAQLEYANNPNGNLIGMRFNIQYAPNKNNLFIAEAPILYNTVSRKAGFSDFRIRYFTVVKRNLSARLIAVAPFLDITAPTGSTAHGLGQGSWSIAAGGVIGYVVSSKFAMFPGLGYVHITRPTASAAAANGITLQMNGSYSFSKRTFMFINPTPVFLNRSGVWHSVWAGDLSLTRILVPNKFTLNLGCSPNFTNDVYIYRMGSTLFF